MTDDGVTEETDVQSGVAEPTTFDDAQTAYADALTRLEVARDRAGAEATRAATHALTAAEADVQTAHAHLLAFRSARPSSEAATAASPADGSTGAVHPVAPAAAAEPDATPTSAARPAEEASIPTVLARRPGTARFAPPPSKVAAEPLVKDRLLSRTTQRHEISRERKIAGSLPHWDPLPPGEVLAPARRG